MAENRTYRKFQKKLNFESHEVMTTTNALGKITPSDTRKGRRMPRQINIWFSYNIYHTGSYIITEC